MGAGDVIAQTLIDKQKIEWNRVGRFAFIGATLVVRQLVHENLGQFVHFPQGSFNTILVLGPGKTFGRRCDG